MQILDKENGWRFSSASLHYDQIYLIRAVCVIAVLLHLFFGFLIDEIWVPNKDKHIMWIARFIIWIPSVLFVLYLSTQTHLYRKIPVYALLSSVLHGLGFGITAYYIGMPGIEYAEMSLVMVTVATYFAFGIPFFVSFCAILLCTSFYCLVAVIYFYNSGQEEHSTDIIRILCSTISVFVLTSFCAYQTECIKVKLSQTRRVVNYGKQSSYDWLNNLASFLKHELRNKQIAAEQSLFLLNEKEKYNANVEKYVNRIQRSLTGMKSLIEQTVLATSIEQSLLNAKWQKINIHSFLMKAVRSYSSIHRLPNLKYISNNKILSRQYSILSDAEKLEQLVVNLLANAKDFHEPNTDILVTLELTPEVAIIKIENKGPLLPEKVDDIFDMSYSNRINTKSIDSNSGFGLFVAKRIASFNQGDISAHNNISRDGVCFTITLPIHKEISLYGDIYFMSRSIRKNIYKSK